MAVGLGLRGLKALWTAARGTGNIVKGAAGTKMTVGGAIALSQAPTIFAVTDGMTGHQVSEKLIDTPIIGPALQGFLSLNEYSNGAKATMVSNAVQYKMKQQGHLSTTDPDIDTKRKIIDVLGHVVVGDEIGAATRATELGIDPSDVVAAYNEEKSRNPNATVGELGSHVVNNVNERIKQQNLQRNKTTDQARSDRAIADANLTASTGITAPNAAGAGVGAAISQQADATMETAQASLENLSRDGLSKAFDEATDRMGVAGWILKGVAAVSSLFGQSAESFVKKQILGSIDSNIRLQSLRVAGQAGQLTSRLGDKFDIGGHKPQLAHDSLS